MEARIEREKSALSSLAGILTNAPMPDDFAVELMQRYVDGELSLAEVKERIITETKRRYSSVPSEKPV
ncbi:antitoxin VbhA family protein [Rufibacter latericius]|uniref:antitoxin VbhA family protein n=1 Tax=Rufibacter latericius TaxID=2487040 RepID=UPI000F629E8E|nr:antitoxin VbhA family protein [Rufibacter latericius]